MENGRRVYVYKLRQIDDGEETVPRVQFTRADGSVMTESKFQALLTDQFRNYKISVYQGLMDEQIYPLEEKTEEGLPEKIFEEEDRRMLYQAILRLDIKKREIIQMQYFGGMTQKEIAAVLHITLENVRVLAYRARKELKKYLEECRKEDSK